MASLVLPIDTHAHVVRGDVTPLRSSLKDHFAAAKIQSAYRRHLNFRSVECSSRQTDPSRVTMDCNKSGVLVEITATSFVKVATTASSSSSENSMEIQPDYVHLAKNATNLQSSVKWLLKFHSRLLRWLQSTVRVKHPKNDGLKVGSPKKKVRNSDHEHEKSTNLNLKLHLEPKSRKKTLQRYLQHFSIFDCYNDRFSSTPHSSPRRRSGVDVPSGLMPVYLNIYDITPVSSCLYWLGIGLHHSGVQVNGVEYAFGTDEYGTAGIFRTKPKECEEFTFRKTILIGWKKLRSGEIRKVIDEIASLYKLDDYSLITRNCNHFSTEACLRLTGNTIPLWVNRLARFGSLFVMRGSNLRRKRICRCNSSASSSSFCSETSSEVRVTGKSSRWKKSVTLTPSLSLDWVL